MPANLKNLAVATGLAMVSFHFNPKESQSQIKVKVNPKECSNHHTIALISHASKVTLKILQARLQQYVNWEIPDVQAGFRKGRGTRDQIANIHWITEKVREFQKNIYCFIDYAKAFDCVEHNKLWEILKEMGIPDHLPGGSDGKASVYNAGDLGLIPGSGRSLEKDMAIHSSTIAWKIPWTEEPDRLQSMGSQRVGHDWATSLTY